MRRRSTKEEGKENVALDASLSGLFAFTAKFLIVWKREASETRKKPRGLYPLQIQFYFPFSFLHSNHSNHSVND
jgi:hypothetical protein